MKPYDATKYLRQMVYKPNIVFLSIFFFFAFTTLIFSLLLFGHSHHHYSFDIEGIVNDDFKAMDSFPEVIIKRDGSVVFSNMIINDLSKLPALIEDEMEKHSLTTKRVLLKIDSEIPFGKVQEVLALVKKANIETIGLITKEHASATPLFWTPMK